MSEEPSFDAQEFVEVVELSGHVCSMEGCSAPPVATYSTVTPIEAGRVSYDVVWGCGDHLGDLQVLAHTRWAEGTDVVTGWTQELLPTCLFDTCEDVATHVVFAARDYGSAQRLEALSVCTRHARQAARRLRKES